MDLKLEPFLHEKTLVFTVTSDGYKYYTWNLYKLLERCKVPWKLCILCLDRESREFLARIAQIPSRLFLMPGNRIVHKDPLQFGTQFFKRMNRIKLMALEQLSQRPEIETLLYLDSDIAVFKDPLPRIRECLETHPLWFQCDEKLPDSFACSNPDTCLNPCSGVIAMRCTGETRPLYKRMFELDSETWKAAVGDQDYIQSRMATYQISYKTLERTEFPNGIFLANNRFREGDPYLLHFNYLIGKAKQGSLKEKECWVLPEYV